MSAIMFLAAAFTQTPEPVLYFDMEACLAGMPNDSVLHYDVVAFVASLQGIVNRTGPRLVIRFLEGDSVKGPINVDDYWLATLQRGWLKDNEIRRMSSLEELIDAFPEARAGVVVWDPAVPATSNVAATVCGVEDWLPSRAGGALFARLVESGPQLPVKLSLVDRFTGSESGSAKCDAYLWAKRAYLDTGKTNPVFMANYIDAYSQTPGKAGYHYNDLFNATITNRDFYIAWRAFFFDLSPWADEAPVDDPNQPLGTDRNTLIEILRAQVARNQGKAITTVGGMTPWNLKYTNHGLAGGQHDPVPTEWEYAAILSAHNAMMDADALGFACLTNASAYAHHPLQLRYKQSEPTPRQMLMPKTYVLIYMGDYDSSAWLSRHIPLVWDDESRGSMPIAWAFNPNLSARVPYVFDHVFRTKTPNDYFIAGEGVGYLNPNLLIGERMGSGVPEALDIWTTQSRIAYQRFDMSITGFVITGKYGDVPLRVQEAFATFSPNGIGTQLGYEQPIVRSTPFLRHAADIYPNLADLGKTAAEMARYAKPEERPQFLIFRMILQTPSTLIRLREHLNRDYGQFNWEFCDPYTFFSLYERSIN